LLWRQEKILTQDTFNVLLTFWVAQEMNAEEALACLEVLLPQTHLNKLQISIFQQVWEDHSYLQIAQDSGYGLSHIKQTGSELWQLLSQNLGEKVSKTNERSFRTQAVRKSQAHAPSPPSPECSFCCP
jgi:hypothetical protein